MSERVFPEVSIPYGDKATAAMQITCSGCQGVAYFPFLTGVNRKPPIAAVQHYQAKGWVVGSNPRKDLCPACARPRKQKGQKAMVEPKAIQADAPATMTREDRRIINDKLDQVYGKDAYRAPWTDAAVAKDLGVPRDWVRDVREQFFGPEGSNPLFDEFLAAREAAEGAFKAISETMAGLEKQYSAIRSDFLAAQKLVDDARRIGKRVEREIGR